MAENKDFKKRLSRLKGAWDEAKDEAKEMGQRAEVDDGTYIARVTGMKLVEVETKEGKGKPGTELKMVTDFTVVEGDEKGKTVSDWRSLEREDSLKWVIVFLRSLGVSNAEDFDIDSLEEIMEAVVAERGAYRIRLKTGDSGYQNLRVLKAVETDEDVETKPAAKKGKPSKSDEDDDDAAAPKKPSKDEDDDEDDDEDEGKPAFKKGDRVSFKQGKHKIVGGVIKVKDDGDTLVVVDDDGDRVEVPAEDCKKVAEPDEDD